MFSVSKELIKPTLSLQVVVFAFGVLAVLTEAVISGLIISEESLFVSFEATNSFEKS